MRCKCCVAIFGSTLSLRLLGLLSNQYVQEWEGTTNMDGEQRTERVSAGTEPGMKAARRTVGRCKAIQSLRQRLYGLTEQKTFLRSESSKMQASSPLEHHVSSRRMHPQRMTGQSVSYSFCIHEDRPSLYPDATSPFRYQISLLCRHPKYARAPRSPQGKSLSKCRTPTSAARM